jgi:hypothetical protein
MTTTVSVQARRCSALTLLRAGLFHSIAYAAAVDAESAPAACMGLRNHCADVVTADAENYPDYILGMDRESYPGFIKNKFNWGGENEILILSKK